MQSFENFLKELAKILKEDGYSTSITDKVDQAAIYIKNLEVENNDLYSKVNTLESLRSHNELNN